MGCGGSIAKSTVVLQDQNPNSAVQSVEFSSEVLNFQMDDRMDQHKIETKEDDYPDAVPPEVGSVEHMPVNNWFTDENFQTGNDEFVEISSDEYFDLDMQSDTTSIATRDTNPISREWKKNPVSILSFAEIDKHAKCAGSGMLQSFSSLADYLKSGTQFSLYKETMIARALIMWLSNQNVDSKSYGKAGTNSPKELLQSLKEKKMTYATCYAMLCRKAGLKCVFIKGVVKACNYEPGDKTVGSSPWTAVYVDGSWQIVNPFWVCRALYGHTLGGWVKVEADGKSVAQREKATKGIEMNTFQEYYFMPKPGEYIYECYTDQTEWQLLPAEETVRSRDKFLQMPYLLPPFFGLGLELTSERNCVLQSKDGVCRILLKGQRKNYHLICLEYELFVKDTSESTNMFLQGNKLPRLVFNSRSGIMFTFEIRFPVEGEYKLVIYGGLFKSSKLRLCEFKLNCKKRMQRFSLLPVDDRNIGWGPGPLSEAAGLLLPSRTNGLIPVQSPGNRQKVDCRFTLNKLLMNSVQYSSVLISSDSAGEENEYPSAVTFEIDEKLRQFNVQTTLPGDGEYALLIKSRKCQDDGKVVCNYLLSTSAKKPRMKTPQKLAKDKLFEALESEGKPSERLIDTIEKLKDALERCKKAGLDSTDEDVYAGETRLEFIIAKNALRDCELRRHLGVTIRTLERIDRYRNKDALHVEIQRAVKVKTELQMEVRRYN